MGQELNQFYEPPSVNDIVAVGGALSTENLVRAYRSGIFPWPIDEEILPWFCPERRAILDFSDLHIPKRLARVQRQQPFHFTIDRAFQAVIVACATVRRKEESGTWITRPMINAYCKLHLDGHAHSVEAWQGQSLVGGVYGVDAGGAFSGESMFSYQSNASKLALLHLIEHLRAKGLGWIDIQTMTPHMQALGAKEIFRSEFLRRLSFEQSRKLRLFD
ncbi:MAG TPA: leucyl/phenylalanyl-tRNA--protein transferase [Pyrinomonadaceae bacterium]|nr:leucyl/phenylalanyl-tRNA--protein transferase [Pyrinomonadaceae bacterium]